MSKSIKTTYVITMLSLLIFHSIHFCAQSIPVKGIDLNRPPPPESTEQNKETALPTKTNLPEEFYIKKRKSSNDENSPGFKARKIAAESGHEKNSKEYKTLYNSYYFKFRKEEGSKFYKGITKDPELSFQMQKKNRSEIMKKFMKNVQSRKRTNQLTPADDRYYEKARQRSKELYRTTPELMKQRKQASLQKKKILQKNALMEEAKNPSPPQI